MHLSVTVYLVVVAATAGRFLAAAEESHVGEGMAVMRFGALTSLAGLLAVVFGPGRVSGTGRVSRRRRGR